MSVWTVGSAILLALVCIVTIAWLKGAFRLASTVAHRWAHEAGKPWTLAFLSHPSGAVFVVFIVAAFGLAHPESRWARWFYGDRRMARAWQYYSEDVGVENASE